MWVVAGVLLGLVVLASLVGFHAGPHAHVVAGALGLALAAWLGWMAVDGSAEPVLFALLGADLVVSAAVGALAWSGLVGQGSSARPVRSLSGASGVATSDLAPEGIARIRGEEWSVTCVNGTAPVGAPLHVVGVHGVRLDVWSEHPSSIDPAWTHGLELTGNRLDKSKEGKG
jgi:hypothetical protein